MIWSKSCEVKPEHQKHNASASQVSSMYSSHFGNYSEARPIDRVSRRIKTTTCCLEEYHYWDSKNLYSADHECIKACGNCVSTSFLQKLAIFTPIGSVGKHNTLEGLPWAGWAGEGVWFLEKTGMTSPNPLIPSSLSGCSFHDMSWSWSKTCQDLICIKGVSMVSRIQVISVLWGWSQRFIFDWVSLNDHEGHLRRFFHVFSITEIHNSHLIPLIYVMLSLWCSFRMAARLVFSWFISWTRAGKQSEIMDV